jgi:DNA-binding response OmpR family regulator
MSSRVLVVDDDAYHRHHAAEIMEEAGHDVITAEDGVDGLRKALETEPDLILTDVQMPKLDGWQLVRMLRARPSLAQTPVVFVTSLGNDEQRLQGYRLGVDDYIAKPYDDDELALRVQRVLTRARAYPRAVAGGKALRGDLAHVSLTSLLGFLAMERRSGELLIVRAGEFATLYLRSGNVVRVDLPEALDHLDGADRLYATLDWTDGRFELADTEVAGDDDIGTPTTAAILEHARRRDERTRRDE